MIENPHIADQCELIQDDLDCILDGIDPEIFKNVSQVIVDRLTILDQEVEITTNLRAVRDALNNLNL